MKDHPFLIVVCLLASVFIPDIAGGIFVGLSFSVVVLRIVLAAAYGSYRIRLLQGLKAGNLRGILRTACISTQMTKLLLYTMMPWKSRALPARVKPHT
ncbi:MAG: hypothetical protein ACLPX5_00015 [Dissulfurispiraceae bacterium]